MPDQLGSHFWIGCVLLAFVNHWRSGHRAMADTGRGAWDAIDTRTGPYLLWWRLSPWLVMGLGQEIGGLASPLSYLRPQDLNPWVSAWYVTWLLELCLFAAWVVFGGGARLALERNLIGLRVLGHEINLGESGAKVIAVAAPISVLLLIWLLCQIDAFANPGG